MNTYRPQLYSNGYWLMYETEDNYKLKNIIIVAPDGQESHFVIENDKILGYKNGRKFNTATDTPTNLFKNIVKNRIVGGTFDDEVKDSVGDERQKLEAEYERGFNKGYKKGKSEGYDEGYETARNKLKEVFEIEEFGF